MTLRSDHKNRTSWGQPPPAGCGAATPLRKHSSSARGGVTSECAGEGGFSLIEMLAALVILSLSLGALYQAAMGATRNVRVAAEYTDAVMLAESMLAEHSYVTDQNFAASGKFGQYDWQVRSWPAEFDDGLEPEQRAVAPQPLQYLEVVVSWPGRNAPRVLDLFSVVPLRAVPE